MDNVNFQAREKLYNFVLFPQIALCIISAKDIIITLLSNLFQIVNQIVFQISRQIVLLQKY